MAKGVSIKFKSYSETIPILLNVIKFGNELKRYDKIVLKPALKVGGKPSSDIKFVEEVFIAEGVDGENTMDIFAERGYKELAERYGIGLIDLNDSEIEEIDREFLKFDKIKYPKILKESFVVSLPVLSVDEETDITGALEYMLGAFPAQHYSGWFGAGKKKLKAWPLKFAIHDILKCKMPEFGIIDASERGVILAGQPIEIDKQAAKLIGLEWKNVRYLRLVDESLDSLMPKEKKEEAIA